MRLLLCLLALAFAFSAALAQPVVKKAAPGWTHDLTKALKRAKTEKKLVLVDFTATWCGPCQMYKKQLFTTKEFKQSTKNVILVEIDVDEQPRVAKKYSISPIPDIRILSPQGKEVDKVIGFDPETLMEKLALAQKRLKK